MTDAKRAGAERYVETFAACWKQDDAETFLADFCSSMHEDIRLIQPLVPPSHGHAAFRREFARLRRFVPNFQGEVKHWAWSGEVLYIELELRGTLGNRQVSWRLIDRFRLDEQGQCRERISFFDPLPLLLRIALLPGGWPRLLRSGMVGSMLRSLRPAKSRRL